MKRRRVSSKRASAAAEVAADAEGETQSTTTAAAFPRLFGGEESAEAAGLRRQVFDTAWPVLDWRIKVSFIQFCFCGLLGYVWGCDGAGCAINEVSGFRGGGLG